jgi:aspartate racemase
MATIGILGGMGAMATAVFYTTLTNKQKVKTEQEYLDAIIYSKTSIPDRSAFILSRDEISPANCLTAAAKTLEQAGVNFIAMPCVTAHYFYEEIASAVKIPVLNLPEEIALYVKTRKHKKVGLLATDGTIVSRIIHNVLEPAGIEVLTPEAGQQNKLMDLIYEIKKNNNRAVNKLTLFKDELFSQGAETIILGCTELSLTKRKNDTKCIDVLEILADAALRTATNEAVEGSAPLN